jgi:broad specificity phosphatase PhoE
MPSRRLLAAVLLSLVAATAAHAAEVIVVVRHAERATGQGDDDLSSAGQARAQKLAKELAGERITHVFVSDRTRTQQTAAPTAAARKVTPVIMAIADQAPGGGDPAEAQVRATVTAIAALPANARVLVVGHSNTVPLFLAQLGATETVTIRDDEFDNIFVVTPVKGGAPKVVRRKY